MGLIKRAEEMAVEIFPSSTEDPVGKKRASVESSGTEQEIAPGDEEFGETPLKKLRSSPVPPLPTDEEPPPPEPEGHNAIEQTTSSFNRKGEHPRRLRLSVQNSTAPTPRAEPAAQEARSLPREATPQQDGGTVEVEIGGDLLKVLAPPTLVLRISTPFGCP